MDPKRIQGLSSPRNIIQYIIIIVSLLRGHDSEIFSHLCPHHDYKI